LLYFLDWSLWHAVMLLTVVRECFFYGEPFTYSGGCRVKHGVAAAAPDSSLIFFYMHKHKAREGKWKLENTHNTNKTKCVVSSPLLYSHKQSVSSSLLTNHNSQSPLFSQQTNKPLLLPLSLVSIIIFSLHSFFKSSVSLSSHSKSKPR